MAVIALIVLPLLVFLFIAFVFQTSSPDVAKQEYLLNCPYPIYQGAVENATLVPISNPTRVDYQIDYGTGGVNATNGSFFNCYLDPPSSIDQTLVIHSKPYGTTKFLGFPTGWYAWVGDTINIIFSKIQPFLTLIALVFVAPSQVTGISWFTYINIGLVIAPIIGIILLARGG